MTIKVTVELPDDLAERARAAAAQVRRPFEEMLVEWIDRAVAEPPVDSLSDEQVCALSNSQMDQQQQQQLNELLAANREGALLPAQRVQLNELLAIYRRGLVRKAQALQAAVQRGLRPPLN